MTIGKPIQLILPWTYDETKRRKQKRRPDRVRRTQDEATLAEKICSSRPLQGFPKNSGREE